jgi:hypothetical protein
MARRVFVAAPVVVLAAAIAVLAWSRGPTLVAADAPGAFGFHAGELAVDFRFRDVRGRKGRLAGLLDGKKALVLALRTAECPVSRKYGHRLAELERALGPRGVGFAFLDISSQDTEAKIREDLTTFGFTGPYIADPEARIGRLLHPRVSSEVFVIDATRTLRYRGAIDDQFGLGFDKPVVGRRHLVDALEEVLAGRKVKVPETAASGCVVSLPDERHPEREITYHSRASRILQESCTSCHRQGGVAPFALDTYQQAYGFRAMIKLVVEQRRMPPWFANPAHGSWANDRTLADRDRRDLLAWIDAGAPEGDPSLATAPRHWPDGWQLDEEPDVVFEIPAPEAVPAQGVVDYRYVYVRTDFAEDKWITRAEARPTAWDVTHHIIAFMEAPGDTVQGPLLVGYAPGLPPAVFPSGAAKRLPKGAWIKFQLHYTPNGKPRTDRSKVGFVLADGPPDLVVETSAVANHEFEIPPHAANHEVVAEREFKRGGTVISMMPHLHLRGKAYRYELVRSDGSEEIILDVPRYDFNWQLWYEFKQPLVIRPGDKLRGRAWYDNSSGNPANPDPSATVKWGDQSFEEMQIGFFDWIPDPAPKRARSRAAGVTAGSP